MSGEHIPVDLYFKQICNLITNLKKAPNRRYRDRTIIQKITQSKHAYNEILNYIEQIDEHEQKFLLQAIRKVHAEVLGLLQDRLTQAKTHLSLEAVVWATIAAIKFKRLITRKTHPSLEAVV